MLGWRCGTWISSHLPIRLKYSTDWVPVDVPFILLVFFIPPFKVLQAPIKAQINAASAPIHSSVPFSTPSFHYLLPPWTCCLGLFKVIGSCPSSSCGQLGSEVSDLFLIGLNGMVIVALCCYSVENKEVLVSKVWAHFFIPNMCYFHGI